MKINPYYRIMNASLQKFCKYLDENVEITLSESPELKKEQTTFVDGMTKILKNTIFQTAYQSRSQEKEKDDVEEEPEEDEMEDEEENNENET